MEYLARKIDGVLSSWKETATRKPLLLRGARQVGKSSSVRQQAKGFDTFLEVNFERDGDELGVNGVFRRGLHPKRICDELSVIYNTPIIPGRTLLFLDEIQACGEAISALRFFQEDLPELHVIAAGSLLEFALRDLASFGVGRIRSLYMYPFAFGEYLRAVGKTALHDAILEASPTHPLPETLHSAATREMLAFVAMGGMPEVVANRAQGGSLLERQEILNDLTFSFYDDFAKYKEKFPVRLLREAFGSVVMQAGGKFVYSKVSDTSYHAQIKESLTLLELAGLILPVVHTSANGLPLAAEMNVKNKKQLPLDTGIYQRYLRLEQPELFSETKFLQVNQGALAELFAGLELAKAMPSDQPAQLYYWHRETAGSNAEVDYIVQSGGDVIPVEVKSGATGSMQSLVRFLEEKKAPYGIRTSLENFSAYGKIQVFPLYALGNVRT
jgi:predicted AAA+ superfamily ATPase